MKVNMHGLEMEMTPEEYIELAELMDAIVKTDKDNLLKNATFDDEMHILSHLKYFKLVDTEISSFGGIKVTLRSDLG